MLTYAKIQIWKQFTTTLAKSDAETRLCLPMQRYKFESNSQPIDGKEPAVGCCAYLCKDTNLKAIHNLCLGGWLLYIVVLTYAKIQIWKQFTTKRLKCSHRQSLCLPMQRYKFESNSQPSCIRTRALPRCAYLCKDTNLKAIHNCSPKKTSTATVVLTYAKIQIWKQFTTCFSTLTK